MGYNSYCYCGDKPPRIVLYNSEDVIISTIDLDDVMGGTVLALDDVAPILEYRWVENSEIETLITGRRKMLFGGFYFEGKLRFPLVDKTTAGYLTGIINHCARPGCYAVFYPYMDKTDFAIRCLITGEVTPFDEARRQSTIGQSATLTITGVEPYRSLPWDINYAFYARDKGSIYSDFSLCQAGSKAASYNTSVKNSLGYAISKGDIMEVDE